VGAYLFGGERLRGAIQPIPSWFPHGKMSRRRMGGLNTEGCQYSKARPAKNGPTESSRAVPFAMITAAVKCMHLLR